MRERERRGRGQGKPGPLTGSGSVKTREPAAVNGPAVFLLSWISTRARPPGSEDDLNAPEGETLVLDSGQNRELPYQLTSRLPAASMSSMGEPPIYSIQPGRTLHTPQTPYSAVSSFNLPVHYDSSLMTPVTMSESPSVPTKSPSPMHKEKRIKLSPSGVSPNYALFCTDEDDFGGARYSNAPMKHKEASKAMHASTPESTYPVSPYICADPYWGSFGVSATPGSARDSISSPTMQHQSPNLNSAGSVSNDSRNSRQPTPGRQSTSSYRSHNQAPILIAPNPSSLRTKDGSGSSYRQNSVHSNQSSTPRSQGPPQGQFLDQGHQSMIPSYSSISSGSKKRKTPDSSLESEVTLSGEVSFEEQLLLQLTDQDQLPWKEVMSRFNERTGKNMKVPALQMRKKRLIERLRERALDIAWEDYERSRWEQISKDMLKHGCAERWTKEAVQRKWNEMHPNSYPSHNPVSHSDYLLEYSYNNTRSHSPNSISTSTPTGPGLSVTASAVSTVTMDEVRSRADSDASAQLQIHKQQARMMFEQQPHPQQQSQRPSSQHRNSWGSSPISSAQVSRA
ncbi:hypothetical protein G7Y89_g4898 [Cudoniella acicularis]|uniref:Myb-like domain-containing protein n=1 Tax=Cudoniella acicularis TaxID=354080 RepID=A0A8H4RQK5_9HELO|nr:hypothetical protein G7Y89_g4898 [Cudoniella acicularis]